MRDLLVELACTRLFRAVWTERIHEEWIRNVLRNRTDLDPERLRRTASLMNEAVEDCLIEGYEGLIPSLNLPDKDDRHVLAAAIVTANLQDFPPAALAPYRLHAQHPDVFVTHVLDLDNSAIGAVRTCRERLRNPSRTVDDYLDTLLRQGLPGPVSHLRRWATLI